MHCLIYIEIEVIVYPLVHNLSLIRGVVVNVKLSTLLSNSLPA